MFIAAIALVFVLLPATFTVGNDSIARIGLATAVAAWYVSFVGGDQRDVQACRPAGATAEPLSG
jgi:hypothetical protein